jgi:hypothetical protein
MQTLLESIDALIEEELQRVIINGKYRTITKKQRNNKVTGKTWNGKRYVVHTGAEKLRYKKAAKKRAKTMKVGKAQRALASKRKKIKTDRLRRTKRLTDKK